MVGGLALTMHKRPIGSGFCWFLLGRLRMNDQALLGIDVWRAHFRDVPLNACCLESPRLSRAERPKFVLFGGPREWFA